MRQKTAMSIKIPVTAGISIIKTEHGHLHHRQNQLQHLQQNQRQHLRQNRQLHPLRPAIQQQAPIINLVAAGRPTVKCRVLQKSVSAEMQAQANGAAAVVVAPEAVVVVDGAEVVVAAAVVAVAAAAEDKLFYY